MNALIFTNKTDKMTNKPKTTHGGRRANAGRKPSPYPLKVRNIKVPEHWPWNKGIRAKIRELIKQEVRS